MIDSRTGVRVGVALLALGIVAAVIVPTILALVVLNDVAASAGSVVNVPLVSIAQRSGVSVVVGVLLATAGLVVVLLSALNRSGGRGAAAATPASRPPNS